MGSCPELPNTHATTHARRSGRESVGDSHRRLTQVPTAAHSMRMTIAQAGIASSTGVVDVTGDWAAA